MIPIQPSRVLREVQATSQRIEELSRRIDELANRMNDLHSHIAIEIARLREFIHTQLCESEAARQRVLEELTPEDIRGMAREENAQLKQRIRELEQEVFSTSARRRWPGLDE